MKRLDFAVDVLAVSCHRFDISLFCIIRRYLWEELVLSLEMADIDKSQHVLPLETPVVWLDASTAFEGLEDREKNYAYHLTRASWVGSLATFLQVSPESGKLFVLLHKIFRAQSAEELKKAAVAGGFSEDDVNAVLVYAAGIFSNAGNYKVP